MHGHRQFQCFIRQALLQADMACPAGGPQPIRLFGVPQRSCHSSGRVLCSYCNLNLLGFFVKNEIILNGFKVQIDCFPDIFNASPFVSPSLIQPGRPGT
jgi:hypothetical protein